MRLLNRFALALTVAGCWSASPTSLPPPPVAAPTVTAEFETAKSALEAPPPPAAPVAPASTTLTWREGGGSEGDGGQAAVGGNTTTPTLPNPKPRDILLPAGSPGLGFVTTGKKGDEITGGFRQGGEGTGDKPAAQKPYAGRMEKVTESLEGRDSSFKAKLAAVSDSSSRAAAEGKGRFHALAKAPSQELDGLADPEPEEANDKNYVPELRKELRQELHQLYDTKEPEKLEEKAKGHRDLDEEVEESEAEVTLKLNRRGWADDDQTKNQRTQGVVLTKRMPRPASFLPSMFYFENTYLGGDAGYRESLRRLDAALGLSGAPHRLAALPNQGFDAPAHDGLALTATIDRSSLDEPGRVYLQVGIRGSERYGWRRPPLEMVAVVDVVGLGGTGPATSVVEALLARLGPQDRLAIVGVGNGGVVAPLEAPRRHRAELLPRLEQALSRANGSDLESSMRLGGALLADANLRRTTAPGTQVVLVVTASPDAAASTAGLAAELGLQGVVTSVIGLGTADQAAGSWSVAAYGNGNLHAAPNVAAIPAAIDSELELLARVVARLVRVNIVLPSWVHPIRVLGSRPLLQEEVRIVKAREVETDRRLSKVLGIEADRGDDDEGIQTVIPVFYGGDSHVIVLELWADKAGPVADVSVKYKDLVNLDNATARTSVTLRSGSHLASLDQRELTHNVRALEGSDVLNQAAQAIESGDTGGARQVLDRATPGLAASYGAWLDRADRGEVTPGLVAESLRLAARRTAGGGG